MPSFTTPAYRPNRSTIWRNSFYYLRTDAGGANLPAISGDTRIAEMVTYQSTLANPVNYLRFATFGQDDWDYLTTYAVLAPGFEIGQFTAPPGATYFVDGWPTPGTYTRPTWTLGAGIYDGAISYPTNHQNLWFNGLRAENSIRDAAGNWREDFNQTGDKHTVMWSEASNELVESIGYTITNGLRASNVVTFNTSSYTLPVNPTTGQAAGMTAARLPLAPFFFTHQDLVDAISGAGDLGHMLGWTAADYRNTYEWPARNYDGVLGVGLPAGSVIRLKPDNQLNFDPSTLNPKLQVLVRTLQRYGAMLYDKNSNVPVLGVPCDPAWPTGANDLGNLLGSTLTFTNFEVVDMSSVAGATNSIQHTYTPPTNIPPTAGWFTPSPTTGQAPLTVEFVDTSTPGTGTITGWLWNFGDGTTSTAQNPTHTYTRAGTFNASLTVTNSSTLSNTNPPQAFVVTGGPSPGLTSPGALDQLAARITALEL